MQDEGGLVLGGHFYRAEAIPTRNQTAAGPPYSLLQGDFFINGLQMDKLPKEGLGIPVQRGTVCHIPNTNAFFISLMPRPEWNDGFTVFGALLPKDFPTVDRFLEQPVHVVVHPQYKTEMRMMDKEVPFQCRGYET